MSTRTPSSPSKSKAPRSQREPEVDCDTTFPISQIAYLSCFLVFVAVVANYGLFMLSNGSKHLHAALYPTVSHHPEFDTLIPSTVTVETIANGFSWVEGPAWVYCPDASSKGYLIWSDIPNNVIYKWAPGQNVSVFFANSGHDGPEHEWRQWREPGSNGLAIDPNSGQLFICEHANRQVSNLVVKADRLKKVPIATKFNGHRLNSPNDIAFANASRYSHYIFFTDPPYGFQDFSGLGQLENHREMELTHKGVYSLSADFQLKLLTTECTKPNGIALSPDEETLYVSVSDFEDLHIKKFKINKQGELESSSRFVNFTVDNEPIVHYRTGPGAVDGLAVAPTGHLFVAGPSGVYVFDSSGLHLGTVLLASAEPLRTGNLVFGPDGYLYIACDNRILRIQTNVKFEPPKAQPDYCNL